MNTLIQQQSTGTLLLVEDEPLVRMAIAGHLEDCGYIVLQAEDADHARTLLQWHPEIDVVFTDVRMPGAMSGFELAKWVIENRPHVAVMVASGEAAKGTVLQHLGGAKVFPKPYNFDEVTKHIQGVISSRVSQ